MMFYTLKDRLVNAPILQFPLWDKTFHLHVDTSGIAIGVFLTQPGEGIVNHPLCFASRKLTPIEKNIPILSAKHYQ